MSSATLPRHVGVDSRWRIVDGNRIDIGDLTSRAAHDGEDAEEALKAVRERLIPLQDALYASQQFAVLVVFQALDAAGKDGTIREVFEKLGPAAVSVSSFKKPSSRELRHDFLWRTTKELPERGHIKVFNRSYYEEVLAVRVHPEFLDAQFPLGPPPVDELWPHRYRAIREHERHLAIANTLILKFWLHVSPEEQARRFLDRIEEPDKRWKFSKHDVYEAGFREAYDEALVAMLNETSRPWAPWFVIPADDKDYMRWQVAKITHEAMAELPLRFPQPDVETAEERERIAAELRARIGA